MSSEYATFSAKEVLDIAGLSYRQINDWDARGTLPNERTRDGGWRRFSPRHLFIVMVIAELRRRFGVPLKRLDYVRECMTQKGANHLVAAVELMSIFGVGVWLLTDLEETFIMDSELEFLDLMGNRFFGGDSDASYLFLKVNPLVNRVLEAIPEVGPIESHGKGYEIIKQTSGTLLDRNETFVVESLRRPEVSRVEVVLKSGEIKTIRTAKKADPSDELQRLLSEHPYQKLTVVLRGGEIVSVEQESVHKAKD
jgi:DNA-binding transcriptional MerR regulator